MATNLEYQTINNLITEVLANLGVLSSGQVVDPEDYSYVNNVYDPILRKCAALDLGTGGIASYDNSIPGEWFMDLVAIVAGEVAAKFGYTGEELAAKKDQGLGGGQLDMGQGVAAKSLKQLNRLKPTQEPLRADYF